MPLTNDQVSAAFGSVQSRCIAAIADLESKKSVLGWATGNNDTVEQSQGALKIILNNQLNPWKQNGLDLAAQGDDALPNKVQGWVDVGNTFTNAISEVDGFGSDATIQSVLIATAKQTGSDLADQIPNIAIGFGAVAAIVGVAVVGYFVFMAKARGAVSA